MTNGLQSCLGESTEERCGTRLQAHDLNRPSLDGCQLLKEAALKGSSRKSLGFHDQRVLLSWLRWRKSQLLQTLTDMMKGDDEVLAIRGMCVVVGKRS